MVILLCVALVNARPVRLAGANVLVSVVIIVWKDVVVLQAYVRHVGPEIDSVNVKARSVKQIMNVVMMALVFSTNVRILRPQWVALVLEVEMMLNAAPMRRFVWVKCVVNVVATKLGVPVMRHVPGA